MYTPCSIGTFSETEVVLVEQDQVIDKTEPEVKSRQSQSCSSILNHNIDHDHCYSSFYQSSFDIGFVNVHKLSNKLDIPDMENFIRSYKILGCAETKVCVNDLIEVKGYMYFNSKFSKVAHKSGGVGVFIDESLKNEIDIMNCADHCKDCGILCNIPDVLWILLGKVLFVIAYIHPEGSVYADNDLFDTVTFTTIDLMNHFDVDKLCMMGDYNARTGGLDDFIVIDEQVIKANPCVPNIVNECLAIPSYDIDNIRISNDTKNNNYGKCLVKMCHNLDVKITNGRFGVDSSLPTCKDVSV